ncbi:MAG: response regulator transcription factor [Pseudomonadales bacterium]
MNIFLIDDHEVMRDSLARYLAVMGHRISGMASNAEEALLELKDAPVDLAIVDVSLPGMSGISLVSELRQQRPEVRCVMLSGHREERYVNRAMEAGAHGYLLKGSADLLERLEQFATTDGDTKPPATNGRRLPPRQSRRRRSPHGRRAAANAGGG